MIEGYVTGGFIIRVILMDTEFEKLTDMLGKVKVKIAAARENVAEVERTTRTLKELGI